MKPTRTVEKILPLDFVWETQDPFLFCVHHDDAYPHGNEKMGPATSLAGRRIGNDFEPKDGWRMYHGDIVPGFPQHPHRGFETITVVRRGYVDHHDSLGACGRYGEGDVQWMTAGGGICHSEMFPLVKTDESNPTELFQIWLNLPKKNKMTEPYFSMLWGDSIPRKTFKDKDGRTVDVAVVAGSLEGVGKPPSPPPKSWAAEKDSHVAVVTLKLSPGAKWTLPKAPAGADRMLYLFEGGDTKIGGESVKPTSAAKLVREMEVPIEAGSSGAELLLLQGRPIGEPVVHYGPFVMNEPREIQEAIADYRRTGFGGWPWMSNDPVQPRAKGRFATYPDGKVITPDAKKG